MEFSERLNFSQRNGLVELPSQLQLRKVSESHRRLIEFAIFKEMRESWKFGKQPNYLVGNWLRFAEDFHVVFLGKRIPEFRSLTTVFQNEISSVCFETKYSKLFDFLEFLVGHDDISLNLKNKIAQSFFETRSAYRMHDGQVIAVGNHEQAEALTLAFSDAEQFGARAARTHLRSASTALKNEKWADCVRESINAVEATVRKIDAGAHSVDAALKAIEKRGHLHPALKKALNTLYGYTSDEEGVRHSLVFEEEAKVDETDSLFMLGACSVFVSFLLRRCYD